MPLLCGGGAVVGHPDPGHRHVAHGRYWLPHLPFLALAVFAAAMTLTKCRYWPRTFISP